MDRCEKGNLDTWSPCCKPDDLTPHGSVAVDPTCDARASRFSNLNAR